MNPIDPVDVALGALAKSNIDGMSWPSWMDSLFVSRTSKFAITHTATTPGSGIQAIPANARRWAIGFIVTDMLMNDVFVSPWIGPTGAGFKVRAPTNNRHFTLFEFGPMVTSQWYVDSAGVEIYSWYEIYQATG